MGICISDFLTHGKKGSKCGGHLVINSRKRTLAVIRFRVNYRMLPLTLNDHIVRGHTCIHDLPNLIFRLGKCREPNNIESSLKHTKCTLDILPASLLTLSKPRLLPPGRMPEIVLTKVQRERSGGAARRRPTGGGRDGAIKMGEK
jgi:hypothetical protein